MSIIPLPTTIEDRPGYFQLTEETAILTDADNRRNAEYLQRLLAAPTDFTLNIRSEAGEA